MTRRLLSPFGGAAAFLLVAGLVAGGLGWVTVAALDVEAAELSASARADAAHKEHLALWQLDGRLLPPLGVETSRPYAHYFALHTPAPLLLTNLGDAAVDPVQAPSPLLTAELPDWMLLHFQIDPQTGWSSPQVVPPELDEKLRDLIDDPQSITNTDRREFLKTLQQQYPAAGILSTLTAREQADPNDSPLVVPFTGPEPPADRPAQAPASVAAQSDGAGGPRGPSGTGGFGGGGFGGIPGGTPPMPSAGQGGPGGGPPPQSGGPGSRYAKLAPDPNPSNNGFELRKGAGGRGMTEAARGGNDAYAQNSARQPGVAGGLESGKDAGEKQLKEMSPPPPAPRAMAAGGAPGSPAGPLPAAKVMPPAAGKPVENSPLSRRAEEKAEEAKKKAETERLGRDQRKDMKSDPAFDKIANRLRVPLPQPPAVHLGPMRPQWLRGADGVERLFLVRAARLQTKTVYQGVVLDWPRLKEVLAEEVRPHFPAATLEPVRDPAEATERTMTALPVRLDPGPPPAPPSPGWTPLRLGLVMLWAAAAVALVAAGTGGRALVALSDRRIRFVSAVTHELRTPLTSLRLYLDLLSSGMVSDEEKQREYLLTLNAESDRLNRLIENVLDYARLEKRVAAAHLRPLSVGELLGRVDETWAARLAADGRELVVVSTLPPELTVTTDAGLVAQVLGNLIDNARKYSRDAADGRVWLWAKPGRRGRVVLEVEDRGPGVAVADRRYVFRPFRRGPSADTTAGGVGLGLALAKQWAGLLGGSLTYRPADGGAGACFRLELPAR